MRADGKFLSLTFGAVEVNCVSTSAVLDVEAADADRVTFADVISGNDRRWFFAINALPDYAPGTFWTLLWEAVPFVPIAYLFKPYGNATASPDKPHFRGYVTVDDRPQIGGDAGSAWKFDTRLTCTAIPERVTA